MHGLRPTRTIELAPEGYRSYETAGERERRLIWNLF